MEIKVPNPTCPKCKGLGFNTEEQKGPSFTLGCSCLEVAPISFDRPVDSVSSGYRPIGDAAPVKTIRDDSKHHNFYHAALTGGSSEPKPHHLANFLRELAAGVKGELDAQMQFSDPRKAKPLSRQYRYLKAAADMVEKKEDIRLATIHEACQAITNSCPAAFLGQGTEWRRQVIEYLSFAHEKVMALAEPTGGTEEPEEKTRQPMDKAPRDGTAILLYHNDQTARVPSPVQAVGRGDTWDDAVYNEWSIPNSAALYWRPIIDDQAENEADNG